MILTTLSSESNHLTMESILLFLIIISYRRKYSFIKLYFFCAFWLIYNFCLWKISKRSIDNFCSTNSKNLANLYNFNCLYKKRFMKFKFLVLVLFGALITSYMTIEHEVPSTYYTVTFDSNGGSEVSSQKF